MCCAYSLNSKNKNQSDILRPRKAFTDNKIDKRSNQVRVKVRMKL